VISFKNVSKRYGEREILSDLNFEIAPGEFVCITGPSGAGKSTIIHLLIRADIPTSGSIEVDGANIGELPTPILQLYRRRTGVLFQDYKLLNDRTVEENVAFALEVCGEPDDVIDERVADILGRLRLTDRANAFPHELSGGEKTRAALARALIHKPSILITDEPTGNIDPQQSMQILQFLKEIHAGGTTVILATHDKLVVDALGVRVLRLENGKIVRDSVGGYNASMQPANAPVEKTSIAIEGEQPVPITKKEESTPIKPVITEAEPSPPPTPAPVMKAAEPLPPIANQPLQQPAPPRDIHRGTHVPKKTTPHVKHEKPAKFPKAAKVKEENDDSPSSGKIRPISV
jgi:cell division transport system ATP-binding protein